MVIIALSCALFLSIFAITEAVKERMPGVAVAVTIWAALNTAALYSAVVEAFL